MHASDRIRLCFITDLTNCYLFSFVCFYLFVCAGVVIVTQTRKWSGAFCFTPLSFLSYLAFINLFFSSLKSQSLTSYLELMNMSWIWNTVYWVSASLVGKKKPKYDPGYQSFFLTFYHLFVKNTQIYYFDRLVLFCYCCWRRYTLKWRVGN